MRPFTRFPFSYRLTAFFVSLLLVFSNGSVYSAVPDPVQISVGKLIPTISIPNIFGVIEETSAGKSDKTMIYIQDAHDSLEAQENIAKIIGYLVDAGFVRSLVSTNRSKI